MTPARLAPLHLLAPGAIGGLETVVRMLCEGQLARSQRVSAGLIVDAGASPHPLTDALRGVGIAVREVPVPARRYLREWQLIRELCEELRPSLVHTHGYRADVVAAGAARSRHLPVVATVHGFTGGGFRNRLYERLQRRALRRADAVAAVSHPIAADLVASGVDPSRLQVIPNGWLGAPPLSRAAARQVLEIAPEAVVAGWVGRLSAEKGPDVLVASLAGIDHPATVSFVGSGRERSALEAQAARLGVRDRIRWHGPVPDAGRLMPAFDVLVLSSRTEGTPITLFEAMGALVPIVATAVGGVPDVLTGQEAILVPPADPAALAAGVNLVLADPAGARARSFAALSRLRQVYSGEAWLDRYDELYQRTLARRTQPL